MEELLNALLKAKEFCKNISCEDCCDGKCKYNNFCKKYVLICDIKEQDLIEENLLKK